MTSSSPDLLMDTQRMRRLKVGYETTDDLISELEGILRSGDPEKIKVVVKNCDAFYNKHPNGFSIIEFYEGKRQIDFTTMVDITNIASENVPSEPSRDMEVSNELQGTAQADELIRAIVESGLYDEPDELFGFPD